MLGRLHCYATRRLVQNTSSRLLHSSISLRAKSLRPFLLADIGEGITECEVLKWSVKPDAKVDLFDPLCEVQSDKASVEITSPFEGVVKELLVQEGDIAKVGQGLCIIEVEDSAAVEASPNVGEPVESSSTGGKVEARTAEAAPESPSPTLSPPAAESSADAPAQVARVRRPHPLDPAHPPPPRSQPSKPSSSTPRASLATGTDIDVPSFSRLSPAKNTLAMPSVRHFARKNSIDDLSVLHPGSGKDGRIEMRDVEAHLAKKSQPQASVASTSAAPASLQNQEIELGRTRLAMFRAMTKSLEIPHLGYSTTLDLTALDALLPILNAHIPASLNPPPPSKFAPSISPNAVFSTPPPAPEPTDPSRHFAKLTLLPLLLKSLSRAMLEWPVFRTSINSPPPSTASASAPKPSLTLRPHADISVGLSTPTGLYSPTIQAVDTLNAYEIMGELKRLQHLGRQVPSGLTMKEMPRTGGTVTVSNIGAVGKGDWAHPLLVPGGGVAIVAIGRAKWVWKETEDEPGVQKRRLEVGVSWSADHRVIEGAEMAAFVESWRAWVEQPGRLVADGR